MSAYGDHTLKQEILEFVRAIRDKYQLRDRQLVSVFLDVLTYHLTGLKDSNMYESEIKPLRLRQMLVEGCSACGEDHLSEFERLEVPIEIKGELYDWWSTCSTKSRPIFMRDE